MRKSGEYRRFRRKFLRLKHYKDLSTVPEILRFVEYNSHIKNGFFRYKAFNTPYWEGRDRNVTEDPQGCSGLKEEE